MQPNVLLIEIPHHDTSNSVTQYVEPWHTNPRQGRSFMAVQRTVGEQGRCENMFWFGSIVQHFGCLGSFMKDKAGRPLNIFIFKLLIFYEVKSDPCMD